MKRTLVRAVTGFVIPIVGASAQSVGPRFGLEAAPFYVTVDGENVGGIRSGTGVDVQGRLIGPAWSVGFGWHRSSHAVDGIRDDLILSGFFVEPRFQPPGQEGKSRVYLAARGGRATHRLETDAVPSGTAVVQAAGLIVGAGTGMAFALAPAIDLNASAMWARLSFRDAKVDDQTVADSNLKGTSVFLRAGLTFKFAGR